MATDPSIQIKRELQNIYTYIRSRELSKIIANLTFDDFIQNGINEINKDGERPAKLTKIKSLKNNLDSLIERAKNLPDTIKA